MGGLVGGLVVFFVLGRPVVEVVLFVLFTGWGLFGATPRPDWFIIEAVLLAKLTRSWPLSSTPHSNGLIVKIFVVVLLVVFIRNRSFIWLFCRWLGSLSRRWLFSAAPGSNRLIVEFFVVVLFVIFVRNWSPVGLLSAAPRSNGFVVKVLTVILFVIFVRSRSFVRLPGSTPRADGLTVKTFLVVLFIVFVGNWSLGRLLICALIALGVHVVGLSAWLAPRPRLAVLLLDVALVQVAPRIGLVQASPAVLVAWVLRFFAA